MAASLKMLLFLFKSKYRRKSWSCRSVIIVLCSLIFVSILADTKNDCSNVQCVYGSCRNGSCFCNEGWQGPNCEFCGGRLRLTNASGFINDGPGNYSIDIQCSWLIETDVPNSTLRFRLENFATECGWDHLYIYDGDSVFSPLLGAYSGLILQGSHSGDRIPEVVTSSGSAFLHFFSDVAYNMTGFNISYSTNSCPQNCSNQGVCVDSVCTCNGERTGKACEIPICPSDCSGQGECVHEEHRCKCQAGFTGIDCTQYVKNGFWTPVDSVNSPLSKASHRAIIYNDSMWIFGGESFEVKHFQILRYNFSGSSWDEIISDDLLQPDQRYGHSLSLYQDTIFMFGGVFSTGVITDELWSFNFVTLKWSLMENHQLCETSPCPPLAAVGHTANVINDKIIVIFGHSPIYGYMSTVQEYNISQNKWKLVNATGAIVKGGYGHTSVYDQFTDKIYVHGGYHSVSSNSQTLTDLLYMYDPQGETWYLLTPGKTPRYLHSASIFNGMMLVFGGNTHNDTSQHLGAKCYSTDFLIYDIICDLWYDLNPPSSLYRDMARFGHSSVEYNGSIYYFGGFNGRMLNDIIRYTPGTCDSYKSNTTCIEAHAGIKCMWNQINSTCEPLSYSTLDRNIHELCPRKSETNLCEAISSCSSCLHTSYNCIWCGNFCSHNTCKESSQKFFGLVSNGLTLVSITPSVITPITKPSMCDSGFGTRCSRLHNCQACQVLGNCSWEADKECYPNVWKVLSFEGNQTDTALIDLVISQQCSLPCSQRTSCENCTNGPCIWCGIKKRCVESNAYVSSFPYGQCMEWTTQLNKCPAHTCSEIKTCEKCQENPMCGWCDDASGTGLGYCLEGGSKGPIYTNRSGTFVDHKYCPRSHWFFTECPKCQCNGHSQCLDDSDVCINCSDLTDGHHCEFCINGYYGDPTNGGNCTACDCNHHSTTCHRETGKCFCTTKGITGNHCDRCDEQSHYFGDPRDGGTCFYDLTIDFQFTFNLSKPDDRHYNQINFKNTPTKHDTDADFTISFSLPVYINITVKTASKPERLIYDEQLCTNFKTKFSHSEYSFGSEENTTFYVYVYHFHPPMWIQIAFSQQPKLDLLQFFITFSSCFLSLLVIAAILWKIKQKYDLYRRRQRLFVEMEQMASRPFASVLLEVENREIERVENVNSEENNVKKKKKDRPSPIALEPCFGNRAAVLSLIVLLPTGGETHTPSAQSGIAIASALVTLGNPRKPSTDIYKGELKGKGRKHVSHQHPDTCI